MFIHSCLGLIMVGCIFSSSFAGAPSYLFLRLHSLLHGKWRGWRYCKEMAVGADNYSPHSNPTSHGSTALAFLRIYVPGYCRSYTTFTDDISLVGMVRTLTGNVPDFRLYYQSTVIRTNKLYTWRSQGKQIVTLGVLPLDLCAADLYCSEAAIFCGQRQARRLAKLMAWGTYRYRSYR